MTRAKAQKEPISAKDAIKAGSSFIASTWKPWPQEPSGAWDMGALDLRMSSGVTAVRMLADVVREQEKEIARLKAVAAPPTPSEIGLRQRQGGSE